MYESREAGSRESGAARLPGAILRAAVVLWGAAAGLAATLGAQPVTTAPNADEQSAESGLELFNLDLLDSRDGFAIPPDSRFLPGEIVHLYFQIKGYEVGEEDRVRLRYQVEALDPEGRRFYSTEGGQIEAELAPQDENWMPIVRYSPRIPYHAGGGTYAIRISVEDELAGKALGTEVPFEVDGESLLTAGSLTVRNFRFSKAENGDKLDEPVFGPGEPIWAAFFITGYETRHDNSYDVESDAWVLDAKGERMFAFESTGDEGSPFYPRLWLPAKLRMDLERDIPPGDYTVVLRVRDGVSGSDATERYSFKIR